MVVQKKYKHHMFDDNPAEALGILGDLYGVRMRRVDIILNRVLASATEEYGLKPAALLCMALIVNKPGLSQNDLTLQTTNDKSTIVGVVDQLEALGWARREVCVSDRRRRALFPTPAGEDKLNRIGQALRKKEQALLLDIEVYELESLSNLLERMHESCIKSLDILDTPLHIADHT